MTWDQVIVWLILPAIAAIIIGGGVIWASRHIPQVVHASRPTIVS
jgi:hypothetical protein